MFSDGTIIWWCGWFYCVQTPYLNISIPHVVFVSLQRQLSVFLAHKANQSFSIPPPLSIQAQRNPSSKEKSTAYEGGYKASLKTSVSSSFLGVISD